MRMVLGVCVVALIAVAVWFFGGGAATDAAPARAAVPAAAVSPAPVQVATPKPEARQAVPAVPAAPTVVLRAVHIETKEPIRGAAVGYLTDLSVWQRLGVADRAVHQKDPVAYYRRWGEVRQTDADGRCTVPVSGRGTTVEVFAAGLFGRGYLRPGGPEPQEVALRTDHRLVVRALGPDGRPAAGVQVVLQRPAGQEERLFAPTDGAGRLECAHSQDLARDGQGVLDVVGRGHGIESPKVQVDLLAQATVEVTLHMPRSGSITFALVQESGEPFDLTGIAPPAFGMTVHESRPTRPSNRGVTLWQHLDRTGRLTVHNVALDRFFCASVGGSLLARPVIGAGPTSAQPEITVPITVPAALVLFRGRAVIKDAALLVGKQVTLVCRYDRGMSSQAAETGADGSFVFPMAHLEPDQEVAITFQTLVYGEEEALGVLLPGSVTVRPGVNDLGDLRLGPLPMLLTGRLVVPASLASVTRIEWSVEKKAGKRWEQIGDAKTRWLEDRRFEVRGLLPPDASLRLRFSPGAYLPLEPREFVRGTEGIEIALGTAGTLKATLRVDATSDEGWSTALSVRLDGREKEADPNTRWRSRMQDRHRLQRAGEERLQAEWTGLKPGSYSLVVESPGLAAPLVSIPGIVVRGGPVEDPRLHDIDLRGRLRAITVRVTDDRGAPITAADDALVILADVAGSTWYGHPLRDGAVKLLVAGHVRVRVRAKGFLLTTVDGVREDRTIRLQRAPEVRFRVVWPEALPAGLTPALQVIPQEIDGGSRGTTLTRRVGSSGSLENELCATGSIDAAGSVVLRPMVPGPQAIRIALDPAGRGYYLYGIEPRRIELPTADGEVVLKVDSRDLRRTLDMMKRR